MTMGVPAMAGNDGEKHSSAEAPPAAAGPRELPAAARRALAEAQARRDACLAFEATLPREIGGRGGLEPVRYGDWEVKGLASDF
jgi:hypothetical protein